MNYNQNQLRNEVVVGWNPYGLSNPFFAVKLSVAQTPAAVAEVTVNYNNIIYQIGSGFNSTTYTFTAPVKGIYFMTAILQITGATTLTNCFIGFNVNSLGADGNNYGEWSGFYGTSEWYPSRTSLMVLNANDTVKVSVYINSGTATISTGRSTWQGYLISAL